MKKVLVRCYCGDVIVHARRGLKREVIKREVLDYWRRTKSLSITGLANYEYITEGSIKEKDYIWYDDISQLATTMIIDGNGDVEIIESIHNY